MKGSNMINFVKVEDADFEAAFNAGFSHYRENGSFIEFFNETVEFVPEDAVTMKGASYE